MDLTLQEVLIVGNNNDQVKFSELTLDMFRILQTLEREPQQEDATYGQAAYSLSSRAPSMVRSWWIDESVREGEHNVQLSFCLFRVTWQEPTDRPLKRENPHKYLLYKPTLSQLLVFLASGFKELPPNGALLLYISADGLFPSSNSPEDRNYSAQLVF